MNRFFFQISVDSGQSLSFRLEQLTKMLYSIEDKVTYHDSSQISKQMMFSMSTIFSFFSRQGFLFLSLLDLKEVTGSLSSRLSCLRCFSEWVIVLISRGLQLISSVSLFHSQVKQESLGISTKMSLKVDVESGKLFFKKSKDGPEDKYFVHNKSKLFNLIPLYWFEALLAVEFRWWSDGPLLWCTLKYHDFTISWWRIWVILQHHHKSHICTICLFVKLVHSHTPPPPEMKFVQYFCFMTNCQKSIDIGQTHSLWFGNAPWHWLPTTNKPNRALCG